MAGDTHTANGRDNRINRQTDSSPENSLNGVEHQSLLYDFYGSLLNDNQNEVMALYHEDNLSLSEIAAELGMTRQAVHYTLKKAERALESYEEKLGLLAAYIRNSELAAKAEKVLEQSEIGKEDKESIISIIRKITE